MQASSRQTMAALPLSLLLGWFAITSGKYKVVRWYFLVPACVCGVIHRFVRPFDHPHIHDDFLFLCCPHTDCIDGIQGRSKQRMVNVVTQAPNNASLDVSAIRELSSRARPYYIPSKAKFCHECTVCKEQSTTRWGGTMSPKCTLACKKCPNFVVLGAEKSLSFELGGITATRYTRKKLTAAQQGRVLQSGAGAGTNITTGVNITETHYGTTIFEGQLEKNNGIKHTMGCVGVDFPLPRAL